MKMTLLLSFMFLLLPLSVKANQSEATFGLHAESFEWTRLKFEKWIEQKLKEDLAKFIPNEKFDLYADVKFIPKRGVTRRASSVNLSKFGTVATVNRVIRANPKLGLFGRVSKLKITLVTDKTISGETIFVLENIIKERIPIVNKSKIEINTQRMSLPGKGFYAVVSEFKYPLTLIFIALIFCGLVIYLIKNSKISISHVSDEVNPHGVQANRSHLIDKLLLEQLQKNTDHSEALEQLPTKSDEDETVEEPRPTVALAEAVEEESQEPKTEEEPLKVTINDDQWFKSSQLPIKIKRIRAGLLGLDSEQCVWIAQHHSDIAAVMLMLIPKSKSTIILGKLTPARANEIKLASTKWDEENIAENYDYLLSAINKIRKVKNLKKYEATSAITYIKQIGPFDEDEFYLELIQNGHLEELEEVALVNVPADCIMHSFDSCLIAPFLRLDFTQRVALLHNFKIQEDSTIYDAIMKGLQEHQPSHFGAYKARLLHFKNQFDVITRKKVTNEAWVEYVELVRTAYLKNSEIRKRYQPIIKNWLFYKSDGIIGEKNAKKSA